MLHIVYGGSASGKSSYAESFAMSLQGEGRLLYIATMYPYKWNTTEIDPETMQRIERHRAMRADKGFDTVECYRHVEHIVAKRQDVLLLECMSNLLANEMYLEPDSNAGSDMAETMSPECVKDQDNLAQWIHGGELVIVTNDVFSDGGSLTYDESTREYVKNLAEINCALAREAATVTEVVCGIPVIVKKNHPMGK